MGRGNKLNERVFIEDTFKIMQVIHFQTNQSPPFKHNIYTKSLEVQFSSNINSKDTLCDKHNQSLMNLESLSQQIQNCFGMFK